jgi:hypothetical protein
LAKFPVLPGIERLIILVDHDITGRNAADICTDRWTRAGRRASTAKPSPLTKPAATQAVTMRSKR